MTEREVVMYLATNIDWDSDTVKEADVMQEARNYYEKCVKVINPIILREQDKDIEAQLRIFVKSYPMVSNAWVNKEVDRDKVYENLKDRIASLRRDAEVGKSVAVKKEELRRKVAYTVHQRGEDITDNQLDYVVSQLMSISNPSTHDILTALSSIGFC